MIWAYESDIYCKYSLLLLLLKSFRSNKCIHVKLSGDGTVIGKRLHCVVFAFTILEENSTGSVDGIHPIALFRDSEKYESVKLALADLIDEMKDTDVITVDGETFRIIYSLGGWL